VGQPEIIPWFKPEMTGGELTRLAGVLDRNFLNDGPLTRELEERIAARVGTRHAVAVTSGTAAISLALMAKGIGAGDEVIVPDLTFIATANAVRMAGAAAVLVDVEPVRFTLSVEAVERALTERTRAIVTVDVNGRGADYRALEPFCRERGLVLVCDAAEALGSSYAGRPLGGFGDAGCFSFSANKTVTSGQGGMVVTNETAVYHRLLELKDQGRPKRGSGGDDLHPTMGFNFKFTDVQAAVALAQLDVFEDRLARARQRDAWYADALDGLPGLEMPDYDSERDEVHQWTDVLLDDRDRVRGVLEQRGIGVRAFWFPIHSQAPYRSGDDRFANSCSISRRGLWLPSNFNITEDDVGRVAAAIRAAVGNS
jgi:perosamine synthetase